jgi:hypothetical protein
MCFWYCRWLCSGTADGCVLVLQMAQLALIESDPELQPSLQDMPEAAYVLTSRPDPDVERHPAIRCIFGWRFSLLLWLDESWAVSHRKRIFSSDSLGAAAWETYLRLPVVRLRAARVLRPQYESAAEALDPVSRD